MVKPLIVNEKIDEIFKGPDGLGVERRSYVMGIAQNLIEARTFALNCL